MTCPRQQEFEEEQLTSLRKVAVTALQVVAAYTVAIAIVVILAVVMWKEGTL